MTYTRLLLVLALGAGATLAIAAQQPQQPPRPASQAEPVLRIDGADPFLPPKLAVPDFIPLSNDAETQAAAKMIGQVLWDDLNFEREFYLIARDTYRHPAADVDGRRRSTAGVSPDGVVLGTVRRPAPA